MNTDSPQLSASEEKRLDLTLKRKGRALSAARLGLKDAITYLENAGPNAAKVTLDAKLALKRSYRMENEDGSEQTAA